MTSAAFKIDKTTPTASASRSPAANGNGWNNTDVTVHFTGTDALSEIDFCDADVVLSSRGCEPVGERHVHRQGRKREHASHCERDQHRQDGADARVERRSCRLGSSHYFGSVPPAPTCAAADALSGPDTCVVTGYATTSDPTR